MKLEIERVYIVEGPMYEVQLEDEMGYFYDYFVVGCDKNGEQWTHNRGWQHNETMERDEFLKKVQDRLIINTEHWWKGDVWDAYKIPQTYEEEKRDALEWEANH